MNQLTATPVHSGLNEYLRSCQRWSVTMLQFRSLHLGSFAARADQVTQQLPESLGGNLERELCKLACTGRSETCLLMSNGCWALKSVRAPSRHATRRRKGAEETVWVQFNSFAKNSISMPLL